MCVPSRHTQADETLSTNYIFPFQLPTRPHGTTELVTERWLTRMGWVGMGGIAA